MSFWAERRIPAAALTMRFFVVPLLAGLLRMTSRNLVSGWTQIETFGFAVVSIFEKESEAMKLQPLNDRIVVKRTVEEEVSKGGIIIPDSAKEKPIQGKVLAVGTGKVLDDGSKMPLDVKKGDTVLFSKYAGSEVKIEGEELLIMREDDVLAVVEK